MWQLLVLTLVVLCHGIQVRGSNDITERLLGCYNQGPGMPPLTLESWKNGVNSRCVLSRSQHPSWALRISTRLRSSCTYACMFACACLRNPAPCVCNCMCRLHIHDVLVSAKPAGMSQGDGPEGSAGMCERVNGTDAALSLATLATLDRLNNVEAQCSSWPGRLVVALYTAVPVAPEGGGETIGPEQQLNISQSLEQFAAVAHDFFDRWEPPCRIRRY